MKQLKLVMAFFMVLSIALAASPGAAQEGVYIIVNESNPTSSLTAAELAKIFKGSKKSWGDGSKIVPVVQKSEVKGFFDLIGSTKTKYDKYWIKLSLSGKATPLRSLSDDAVVLGYVKENKNSIGYVRTKGDLSGVKVVDIIE